MHLNRLLSLAVVALAVIFTGCQRTMINEGTIAPTRVNTPNTQIRLNNVSILDPSIAGKIAVEQTNWKKTATGTVEAIAVLRNRTDYHQQLEGRTQFLDENQVPLGEPSAWQRIQLSPNAIQTYRERSLRTDVAYYYIEIREGR